MPARRNKTKPASTPVTPAHARRALKRAEQARPVETGRGAAESSRAGEHQFQKMFDVDLALRESEMRFRKVFEEAPIGMVLVNRDLHFAAVNDAYCRMLGYPAAELIGLKFVDVTFPADVEMGVQLSRQLYEGQIPSFQLEKRYVAKSGEIVWAHITVSLISDSRGRPLYTVAMVEDITERKRAAQAERDQRLVAEAMRDVAAALNSTLDHQKVLERILDNVSRVVPNDTADIMLVEGDSGCVVSFHSANGYRLEDDILSRRILLADFPILRRLAQTREPVVIPDTKQSPLWVEVDSVAWIGSYLGAPILVKGQVIGLLNLNSAARGFYGPVHGERLQAFANQAAVAIENARLFEKVRTNHHDLQRLAQDLMSAQDDERRRVSRELHDEAGQALTSLKINLESIREEIPLHSPALRLALDQAIQLTAATHEHIRLLAHGLRPPALDVMGLNGALEMYGRELAQRTHLTIHYSGVELPALAGAIDICLYRTAQEALANVLKHAQAAQVQVALGLDAGAITLSVEDDGIGFDPGEQTAGRRQGGGIGLAGMQDRLQLLGGRLEIVSRPGKGARLVARVPLSGAGL